MFKARYAEHYFQYTVCYPGVKSVLASYDTAHKKMAIATNKVERITRDILTGLQIDHYFQSVVGPDSVTRRKPHPEAIQRILTQLDSPPAETLMVGDTAADILAGRAAGTITCGVTYGYGKLEELEDAKPDFIIDEITSLLDLIK
jgi:HAD superfamily hydrolase (TIGR01549 family)